MTWKKLGTMAVMAAALALGGAARAEAHKLTGGRQVARPVTGTININTATAKELDMLPGVGRHTAALILAYREKQSFNAPEEITKVKGVGRATYKKIKPYLSVSGPTTLAYAGPARPADAKAGAKPAASKSMN